MTTDEGAFDGGDASAPPPLAMFIGRLTGCIMTQIRAFAKRLDVPLGDLKVDALIERIWMAKDRVYETAPCRFELDIYINSPASQERVIELIETAKKGCFIEQTLSQKNTIRHRMKMANGWIEV